MQNGTKRNVLKVCLNFEWCSFGITVSNVSAGEMQNDLIRLCRCISWCYPSCMYVCSILFWNSNLGVKRSRYDGIKNKYLISYFSRKHTLFTKTFAGVLLMSSYNVCFCCMISRIQIDFGWKIIPLFWGMRVNYKTGQLSWLFSHIL